MRASSCWGTQIRVCSLSLFRGLLSVFFLVRREGVHPECQDPDHELEAPDPPILVEGLLQVVFDEPLPSVCKYGMGVAIGARKERARVRMFGLLPVMMKENGCLKINLRCCEKISECRENTLNRHEAGADTLQSG